MNGGENMNKVILIGRTTSDVETSYTQSQQPVARFRLAVNRRGENAGTDFINCVAWNKTAEVMGKYVKKGNRIGVVGHIQTGSYKDKNDKTIYTTDVMVEELEFLQTKSSDVEMNTEKKEADDFVNVDDIELPF